MRKNSYYLYYGIVNILLFVLIYCGKAITGYLSYTAYYAMCLSIKIIPNFYQFISLNNYKYIIIAIFVINFVVGMLISVSKRKNMPIWYRIINLLILLFLILGFVYIYNTLLELRFNKPKLFWNMSDNPIKPTLIFCFIVILDLMILFGDFVYDNLHLSALLSVFDSKDKNKTSNNVNADTLEKYYSLYKKGAITEEEYTKLKQKVVNKED